MATKKNTKKEALSLEGLLGKLQKEHGEKTVGYFEDTYIPPIQISTGSIELDEKMAGGWQRGRLHEVYGPEASGKSCLTYHGIAETQKAGGVAVYVDAEHAFDPTFASNFGVDCEKLILVKPDSGEQAFDMILEFIDTNEVDMIVIDSVAAMIPQAEIEADQKQQLPGLHARMMGKGVKSIVPRAAKSKVAVIFINQIREKIGVMFGNPETTTGGNALKYYASVRLEVTAPKAGWILKDELRVGHKMRVKVVKNKVAGPANPIELPIMYFEGGIDFTAEIFQFAVAQGVIEKAGAWYSYNGERVGQGEDNAVAFLKAQPEMLEDIKNTVLANRAS